MALGGLLLDRVNKELWVLLGCLAKHHALKQHALIRGLQLDLTFSSAWAYLGKVIIKVFIFCQLVSSYFIILQLYRNLGEKQLASQAFDRARSTDPSLALPWAGMSAGYQDG